MTSYAKNLVKTGLKQQLFALRLLQAAHLGVAPVVLCGSTHAARGIRHRTVRLRPEV